MFRKNLKKFRSVLVLSLASLIIVTSGCSQNKETKTSTSSGEVSDSKVNTSSGEVSGNKAGVNSKEVSDNKANINSSEASDSKARIVTDMVGREVEIPTEINKVFTTSAVGTIALYTINPNKIAGLNSKVGELEKKYLTEEYTKLPILGTYKDTNSGNEEEILKENPDIIISMGNLDESWIEAANESQAKLGIPFLMIDGNIENLDKSYEFLGDILGEEERCKELADYCKKTIDDTKKLASKIPKDKVKTVYYATNSGALSSAVSGSLHTQPIELIGAINVVEAKLRETKSRSLRREDEQEEMSSRVNLSMEQVLKWNPDIIIATQSQLKDAEAYEAITKNSKWGSTWNSLDAVKNNQVYGIPYAPFNWFDRPPSVNRILGVRWLGNLVYPEYFKINIKKETKDFYKMFYHRDLTNKEVDEILENSMSTK